MWPVPPTRHKMTDVGSELDHARAEIARLQADSDESSALFGVLERQFASLQDEHTVVAGALARLQQSHGQAGTLSSCGRAVILSLVPLTRA